jgi:hypothetical protein
MTTSDRRERGSTKDTPNEARGAKTMELLIEITQDDIDHGYPGRCRSCPIARAGNRAIRAAGLAGFVSVDDGLFTLVPPKTGRFCPERVDAALPKKANKFIAAFDEHSFVTPFSFSITITIPDDFPRKPVATTGSEAPDAL